MQRGLMIKDHGAIDVNECPCGGGDKCRCAPKCKWCGFRKHTAIHGKTIGGGDKPYGHMYVPEGTA